MRWIFSRLSLLTKVMLSTSVAITLLFALTGEIVLRQVTQTMSQTLEEEVQASFRSYVSLWKARTELLSSVSQILAGMPDVRASFGTGDEATIRDTAGDLWSKISSLSGVFLVADPSGRVVSSLGGVTEPSLGRNLDLVKAAEARFPAQSSGFYRTGKELYHFAVTPVYVQSAPGQNSLIDVLVAGYRVDALVAQQLKDATHSEFLFLTPAGVIASTLNPRATAAVEADLARARAGPRVSDGVIEYAYSETPLKDLDGQPVGRLCILRSFGDAQQRIAGMKANIAMLWLLAIATGFLLTYLLARRIVNPVRQLDRAAAEVARQNYAIQVPVDSEDELGRLAATFNSMCASIRHAREDLIRQERISTIGRLSASIVHDLRNPLAAIYGGAEMLVDTEMPPAHVKRLAGNIYRSSRRIQGMLQDLLDVSRGKQGAPETCRLREVAMAAADSLAAAAEAQGVKVTLDIAPRIELPLDRGRMERAFVNLIGNALEAMPSGGEVRVRAEMEEGAVVVHVEDDGPGIAPEIRARIFQPFVTARKKSGLGLGLALSRQTVLEHGGDMWVESEPGRGARFGFRLPGAQVPEGQGVSVPD
ncbi:MAG: HAMP domain-containing protein [Acidobacteria bacterium]|nr:HAMP domain-containing protein [Acidobacteriota bacterium]